MGETVITMKTKPTGHIIPNQFYSQLQGEPATDALLCVLLELRVGGILEGMQLETVDYSHSVPSVGGMVITFRRADGYQISINTTDALMCWPDDRDELDWQAETDIDVICATLQAALARLVTLTPLQGTIPLAPRDKGADR